MSRESFRRDVKPTGSQRESPSLHESSLRSSYVNPLSDSNELSNSVQPSPYMHRSASPGGLPRRPTVRAAGIGQYGDDGLSASTTPSGSIDSITQERQRSAASSVSSGRGLKPLKQQPWGDERIDMTPLGLGHSTPWPEIPLSPMARGTAADADQDAWHAAPHQRTDSLSADEDSSEHSEPAHATNPRTPVLDKRPSAMYVDSAMPVPAAGASSSVPFKSGNGGPWASQRKGFGGCLAAAWHYASLGFAEHPLRKHREWTGSVVPYNTLEARHSRSGSRTAGDAYDEEAPAFAGAVSAKRRLFSGCGLSPPEQPPRTLEERYAKNNKRRRLLYALRRRNSSNSFRNRWDCICNEVFIAGELAFDRCTPSAVKHHLPWFTAAYLALQFITFAYMAGQYASFLESNPSISSCSSCGVSDFEPGPHGMFRWVDTWVPCYIFHPTFLTIWGAKYAPLMRQASNWWRWLSSLAVQDSFPHLLATALLYGGLSLHMEQRHGTRRTALLTLTAAVAGNFLDTLLMDPCTVVLASAGCTFGLLVPFLADTAFNFDAISYPVLRLLGMTAALALYIAACVLTGYPGRLVPCGAVLASCFPGLLVLPHLKSEKYEWWVPYCALLTIVVLLLLVPIVIYAARFPQLSC